CLELQLKKLNAEQLIKSGETIEIDCGDDSWNVRFSAFAKSRKARADTSSRIIGVQSGSIELTNADKVRSSIKRKNSHYGELNISYLLAINIFSDMRSIEEPLLDALFGDWLALNRRKNNGVWRAGSQFYNTRMSGALVFQSMSPHFIGIADPKLWHHPAAEYPINQDSWPLRQYTFDYVSDNVQYIDGKSAYNLLDFDREKFERQLKLK
ncbi:MAG: hypothetical protein ACFE0Q_12305, partial [Anaerolineae bacterium]